MASLPMNRQLRDPSYTEGLPECIEEFFDYGSAISCAFNRFGSLLATGTTTGYVGLWDFETRGLAKVLPDDSEPPECNVTSLCWSQNGRYLLAGYAAAEKPASGRPERACTKDKDSGTADHNRIILWDVATGQQRCEVAMPSGVVAVCMRPRKPFVAVVSLASGPPLVVDLSKDKPAPAALDTVDLTAVVESAGGGSTKQRGGQQVEQQPVIAQLSSSGREVFVAQQQAGKGFLLVYDVASKQVLDVYKLPAAVTSMTLNRDGSLLVLTCADKAVWLAEVSARPPTKDKGALKPLSSKAVQDKLSTVGVDALGSLLLGGRALINLLPLTYQNAVEKNAWLAAVVTSDCQHVVGASANNNAHKLFFWEKGSGNLVRMLEGPRAEGIRGLTWHPHSSIMVTLSTNGRVYIWAPIYNEHWSAFAPDFKELEENEEYVESEDEFDAVKNQRSTARGDADMAEAEVEIDICARSPLVGADAEDAEDGEEPLRSLPAVFEAVVPEAPPERETTEQPSSADASDDEGGPEASGRTGGGAAAGADSDGGATTDQGGGVVGGARKRKVRFDTKEVEMDDDAFDELLRRQQQEAAKVAPRPPPPQRAPTKTGRPRGRPPKNRDAAGGRGSRGPGYSGPGNAV